MVEGSLFSSEREEEEELQNKNNRTLLFFLILFYKLGKVQRESGLRINYLHFLFSEERGRNQKERLKSFFLLLLLLLLF
ncbi:MAG: hypothetical protein Q8P67_17720 [archaeon]|nr:hypothetical protein [archaeon]